MNIVAVGYFFVIAWLLGMSIIKALRLKITGIVKQAGAILIGLVGLTELIFWQSWLFPFNGTNVWLGLSGVLLVLSFWWYKKGWLKEIKRPKLTHLYFGGFWLLLLGLIWHFGLVKEADGWYSSCANCYGDWAAHLSYITSFAYGDNFPPQLPILAGERFSYPFLADFMSAILVKLGSNLMASLVWPGLILSLVLVACLYSWGKELGGKTKIGLITVSLFLFNGGLGTAWLNIISSQLLPQRGFLLAMPIVIFVYLMLWKSVSRLKTNYLWLAGGLTASLVLIQAHAFIAVVIVAGVLSAGEIWRGRNKAALVKKWSSFWLVAVVGGLIQVNYFYPALAPTAWLKWRPGWMAAEENWLWFWLKNSGLTLPLAIIGWVGLKKKLKIFSLGFWLIFILANLWQFQPYDWDNTKLLVHWWLMIAVILAVWLNRWLTSKAKGKQLAAGLIFISLTLAGGLDVLKLTQYQKHKYRFWDRQQLSLAEEVKQTTEERAVFLTASNHDHWLPSLAGRKIVMGYPGWLWTYGLDYQQREADIKKIYQSGDKALIDKYKINYILIGPEEQKQFNPNEDFFDQNFPAIELDRENKLYQIN